MLRALNCLNTTLATVSSVPPQPFTRPTPLYSFFLFPQLFLLSSSLHNNHRAAALSLNPGPKFPVTGWSSEEALVLLSRPHILHLSSHNERRDCYLVVVDESSRYFISWHMLYAYAKRYMLLFCYYQGVCVCVCVCVCPCFLHQATFFFI